MIFGVLAMVSLGFAIYIRIQPPTVIRVDKDGNALVVGGPRAGKVAAISLSADASSPDPSSGVSPKNLEGRAMVRPFLKPYPSYTPHTRDPNLSDAFKSITPKL